ncbi:hypothetical protein METHB2_850009 [Candidatus Methylobacter favarea]|uniref:Uncharacterized protein n=1 Tax=Candidatus Methylobacter favarea TaxID=2707345 RepID=A0A8S0WCZ2_9GAMM|nr:hypothetical protein METHB2_850009 [Candidatus Methylobacter favarea]
MVVLGAQRKAQPRSVSGVDWSAWLSMERRNEFIGGNTSLFQNPTQCSSF